MQHADLRGLCDRALLLVGFAGALRRSELAGIVLGGLLRTDHGYELLLKRSKGRRLMQCWFPCPAAGPSCARCAP